MNRTAPALESFNLRDQIVGLDRLIPLLDGRHVPYVNLDLSLIHI